MKQVISKIKRIFRDIFLGFKIAEELKKKSQWGKF